MIKRLLPLPVVSFMLIGLIACSRSSDAGNPQPSASVAVSPTANVEANAAGNPPPAPVAVSPPKTGSNGDLTQLFSRVWRVTKAPSKPALGSINIFLPNGTLVQTSCVEPYRIATWTIDKAAPRVLRVVEDGQLAYTATIAQLTDTTLQLQQTLRNNQKQAITLTAVQQEFVCPDLPK
ncbi:hypothetical protein [Phormidesmis priestleyi]